MNMPYRSILSVLAFLYAGCAVIQPPPAEKSLTSALPETSKVADEWAGDTYTPGQVDDGWIKTFNDAKLEAIVVEVLEKNLSLEAAAAQLDVASAMAVQAGAALKPAVGLAAAGTSSDASGLANSLQSSNAFLNVSWELDIWGRVRAGASAAEAAFRATEADFQFAGQSLAAGTAKAWFLATQIEGQKQLAQESIDIFSKLVELVELRSEVGKAEPQDLPLARANLSTAKGNLRQIEISRQDILRSLELLLGRYPSGDLEASETFVAVPPPIPVGLPSELMERRPDIIAAEQRLAAAFYGVQVAETARLPRVSLNAAAGTINSDLTDILGVGDPVVQLGTSLFAPLYTGGALQAGVEIADAQKRAAMSLYAQKALQAFKEVESAIANEQLLEEREKYLQNAVDDSEEAYRRTKAQFDIGRLDLLALLQTQASLISAKSSLIAIKNERLAERVNLHLALGGSFE